MMMTEVEFSDALSEAKADSAPFSGERKLTTLIDSDRVTPDQRARALYARASLRWKKTFDKTGAKSDFDEYVRLYPTAQFAESARVEAGYVQTEIRGAQSRLQTLQTLRDWFDDTWSLGKREEAAMRYYRSGLTPEPHQVYQLRAMGFLCQGAGTKKVHNYGPITPDIRDLYWCK